ncbi:IclR family transcriptional regulator [Paraburkholderia bonniea]|uniref:IclR family transcriptional regulator n=1 Tax=Paraburkholderia bonniea TaxID=2152891 RepID=UPI001291097D|nr:IclR family transcriptional regulator [Paraburkholderia bonniea]WJF91239.1 IclR family transcriptional regulator [Paraburkholderia bonniea]WJF94554.1 IclR family transcriptional regulator [Paraburkholderia bonniea]
MNQPSTPFSPPSDEKHKEKDRDSHSEDILALVRGLSVLRRIAAANAPLSNRELAEQTSIPKPTVSRITATLVHAGFLFRLPDTEHFALAASVLELSNGFLRNLDIRTRARPFLMELAETTALSVHLAVRDRLEMVVIDTLRPRSAALVSRLDVGSRMPLCRTAVGRVYLGALSASERQILLASLQAAAGGEWAGVCEQLEHALHTIQTEGFAISAGEWHEGLNAIAAGFSGPSGEHYAVSCDGPAQPCTREWLASRAAPALLACMSRIAEEIGGKPGQYSPSLPL